MDALASHVPDDVGEPEVAGLGQTPPPARAPRTSGRIDLGDWDPPASAPAPRRWLLVAAIVPWVVVLAVLLAGAPGDGAPGPATAGAASVAATPGTSPGGPAPDATAPGPAASHATTAGLPAPSGGEVVALGGRAGPGVLGRAKGLAAAAARAWLSTRPAGPAVDGLATAPGADQRYVEHLAVESVDHPARGALVVTLRAIVLPVEDDAYGRADHLRVAVPIVLQGDRARLGGPPWVLPTPELAVEEPVGTPVDDVDLLVAATEAVAAAGYRDVELHTLERTSGWAWVARVRARAPGHERPEEHSLWLRSDVGRLVVAGTAAAPPGAPPSAAVTTPVPSPDVETAP